MRFNILYSVHRPWPPPPTGENSASLNGRDDIGVVELVHRHNAGLATNCPSENEPLGIHNEVYNVAVSQSESTKDAFFAAPSLFVSKFLLQVWAHKGP